MLFKEIISVYSENYKKPINTKCRVIDFKGGGIYTFHCALKG
jgi:hypothetical protein